MLTQFASQKITVLAARYSSKSDTLFSPAVTTARHQHTYRHTIYKIYKYYSLHTRESAVLQIGRLLIRSQLVLLEFFIDIILSIPLWHWGRLSL